VVAPLVGTVTKEVDRSSDGRGIGPVVTGLNILVLVKYVPDSHSEPGFLKDPRTVDRSDGILSELDEYALEAALQLIEARKEKADRITVLTMGPAAAAGALKKALQMGAHEGVLICDDSLAGSDATSTTRVLATAIRGRGAPDIILTGMASTDGGTSVVPAQLAERLELPQISFASSLELSDGATVMQARCDGDDGTEFVEVALPAVVSVTDKINEPRYPSFRGIMAAKKKPLDTLTVADLGLDARQVGVPGAATTVVDIVARPARGRGVIIADEGDAGLALVEFLKKQNVI
jgi:electron transfer flavoprotein beta subunit